MRVMIRALVINTDGTTAVTSREWTLQQLQDVVEGTIVGFYPAEHPLWWSGIANDDGVMLGLPVNWAATRVAVAGGWVQYPHEWQLLGRVVFFGPADGDGDLTDVPDELLALAEAAVPA